MTAPGFLVVDQHVARNPVARAIARQRVAESVRDFACRLYMLADGEDVAADVVASAKVIAVALAAAELRGEQDGADYRVMKGAMGALVAISERGNRWKTTDAVAIDVGLQRAVEVYRTASAVEIQAAHRRIDRIESTASSDRQ